MDDADTTEAQREAAEALQERARLNRLTHQVIRGPLVCDACEAAMPELRQAWGMHFCTECQSAKERNARHFWRP